MKLQHAVKLREQGNKEEAKQLLMVLNTEQPGQAHILYQLAWTCDTLGQESEAVPYYEQAIRLGLPQEDEIGAMLGLGSTYRTLGQYEQSASMFRQAVSKYPERREFRIFYAMTLYNLGQHAKAMELLLVELSETSSDPGIREYRRAIAFYADKLDQIWND
ncbi:tetratricopeptide repeat protein [Paenibacillus protaetiae]|uniref:Tetratricopeptide repeat protein n=1 Tax=Paenibacillus protaetiae TaxID=2509456 RepID=A0A4P6ERZ0_9BACL|nr:tetratricopeptide repeat protein [Paenibacillus protaetiae]QAY65692.1 tetratricopeptide repeat protein [Paenibacillus protaetiae]